MVISTYGGAGVSAAVDGTTIVKNGDTERHYLESYGVGNRPDRPKPDRAAIESRAPEAANNGASSSSTGFTMARPAGTEPSLGAQYS